MIQQFVNKDINDIMELWISYQNECTVFSKQVIVANYESQMRSYLEQDVLFYYEIEGKIIGYISLSPQFEIETIFVLPNYRRSGIGSALCDRVTEKFDLAHVFIDELNNELAEFFAVNSFALAGRRQLNDKPHLIFAYFEDEKH